MSSVSAACIKLSALHPTVCAGWDLAHAAEVVVGAVVEDGSEVWSVVAEVAVAEEVACAPLRK